LLINEKARTTYQKDWERWEHKSEITGVETGFVEMLDRLVALVAIADTTNNFIYNEGIPILWIQKRHYEAVLPFFESYTKTQLEIATQVILNKNKRDTVIYDDSPLEKQIYDILLQYPNGFNTADFNSNEHISKKLWAPIVCRNVEEEKFYMLAKYPPEGQKGRVSYLLFLNKDKMQQKIVELTAMKFRPVVITPLQAQTLAQIWIKEAY
jgi:hypothetical protein